MSVIPNIGFGQILQGASRGVGMLQKWPAVRKAVGYLGVPIFHDLKKEFGPNSEKFDSKSRTGLSYFLKRNFTWGVLASLLAGVGLVINKFALKGNASQEQEAPSLLKGFINLISKVLIPGGVVGSVYADSQFYNVEAMCGPAGVRKRERESMSKDDKPLFEPRDISSLRKQVKHSIMRWNRDVPHKQADGTTKYEDEQERVVALASAPVGTIKGIFLGGTGTGKSVGMDEVCGWTSVYLEETKADKRAGIKEIASVRLDMNRLVSEIYNPNDVSSFLSDIANVSQNEKATQLAGFMQKRKIDKLTNILGSIPDLVFDARKRGIRLIVQIDEIDSIWKLALNEQENRIDFEVLELIARQFQSIIDAKSGIDILMTTNADSPEEILGLKQFPKGEIPVGLRGLLDRVTQLIYRVSHPTPKTQSQQIAAYLLELRNSPELNNPTLDKLLAPELYEPIKDVLENEREDKLAKVIYEKLIAPKGEDDLGKLIFANLNGRDITAYALPGMLSSKLKVRNVPVDKPQISVKMIEEALMPYVISKGNADKKEDSLKSVQVQELDKKQLDQLNQLLVQSDENLRVMFLNEKNKPYFVHILKINCPEVQLLRQRLSAIFQQEI